MRTLRNIGLFALFVMGLPILIANVGASYLMRRRLPDKPDPPSNYGIAYEEVHFTSRDKLKLFGWWIPAKDARGTIILCHGQEGSMDRDTKRMVALHNAGFNVFMFDFRAHGRSEGLIVTFGMYEKEDLLGALDYLVEERHIESVGVIGYSMGAAVALITAALSERICSVVADSSFGRLTRSIAGWFRLRALPIPLAREMARWILIACSVSTEGRLDQTDPVRWTVHIGPRPILFIFGSRDPYVSKKEIRRMVSLAAGPTEVWTVPGAGHRGAYDANPEAYNNRIVDWFERTLVNPPKAVSEAIAAETPVSPGGADSA